MKITKRQLRRIIREEKQRLFKEIHPRAEQDNAYVAELERQEVIDPNALYQSETGEVLDRGDFYDMIRDFSKELTGRRDTHGSLDKLDKMDIQQLADHYKGMFDSQEYNDARSELEKMNPRGDNRMEKNWTPKLRAAMTAPKQQGMGRRPAGSKAQRRMESRSRLEERIRKTLRYIARIQ